MEIQLPGKVGEIDGLSPGRDRDLRIIFRTIEGTIQKEHPIRKILRMDEITAHPVTMGRMVAGGIPRDQSKRGQLVAAPFFDEFSLKGRVVDPFWYISEIRTDRKSGIAQITSNHFTRYIFQYYLHLAFGLGKVHRRDVPQMGTRVS
jgi:hypothetical protein